MKSVLGASVALALGAGMVAANAADIARRPAVVKAPAYVAPVFTWTGPYVGISGGYGWGNSEFRGGTNPTGNVNPDGGLFGATLGYNYQMGAAVVGLEGDISWSGLEGRHGCAGAICRVNNDWLGTVRGRLGYNAGRWMPYVTGGLAVGNIDARVSGAGSNDVTKAGWTLGGGVEAAITGPWSVKLEYLYVDLGRGDNIPGTAGTRADLQTNIVRAGLNYRF
jgi:outer membrane immunogenic protein